MENTNYYIGISGNDSLDENWFGVTIYMTRADAEAFAARHDVMLDTDRKVDADWYNADLSRMRSNFDNHLFDNDGKRASAPENADDYVAVYSIGGLPEDKDRWVEGSGWKCSRSTTADVSAFVDDDGDECNDATEAVADVAAGYLEWADSQYTYEPEEDEDEDDEEDETSEEVKKLIADEDNKIVIISGEGEAGTLETYDGERTVEEIKNRLEEERCGGDRWARAKAYSHSNDCCDVYIDIETGEYC